MKNMRLQFLLGALLLVFNCFAQETDSIDVSMESPFQSLNTFFKYVKGENASISKASIIFSNNSISPQERMQYAKKLIELLDGKGIYIYMEDVPTEANYMDSLTNKAQYILSREHPEIYLSNYDGKWKFGPSAMLAIDAAHQDTFKLGRNLFFSEETKNTILGGQFLNLKYWQWIGIFLVLFVGWFIRFLISISLGKVLVNALHKLGYDNIGRSFLEPISRPAANFIVAILVLIIYPALQLPGLFGRYTMLFLKTLIPLFGMIVLYRMVGVLEIYMLKLAGKTGTTLDDQLVPLVRKVLKAVIILAGALFILDGLNVNIVTLLTGLSIGGLAVALAAQDTIKNFFGSLMIFVDKPFQIGDWITSGNIDGTVEEVGFRSTRVRTFRNSVISIPNGQLADSMIDNNGLRRFRRFRTTIALTYDTPPDLIEVYVDGLKKIVNEHPKTNDEKYEIHFNDMGASSLDILFYIFIEASSWNEELSIRQEILLKIMRLAQKLGVNFAFPTQTIHVENLPGQQTLSPQYPYDKKALNEKMDTFFKSEV